MASFAGKTFKPFKVALNSVGGKRGASRTKIQTVGAAKKLAGAKMATLPLPPTPTSKRVVMKPRLKLGK
jgi:hypothetical protein